MAALVLTLVCTSAPAADAESDGPTALAHEVADALGGADQWNALGGIRWTFGAEVNDTVRSARKHAWAKHTGWHRVDGTTREGTAFCFIHNLETGEGRAWMGNTEIEGDSLQTLLARAKSMWINDSYWFLMPYKLLDPGVHLALEEPVELNGAMCDKLAMRFDSGVGQTSGDLYWVYVDRASRRVVRWEYVLEGREPPANATTWEDWEEHDGLWFATSHRRDGLNIYTRDVEMVDEFDPVVFSEP